MILFLLACGVGQPELSKPSKPAVQLSPARSWVRAITTDREKLYWANYDGSTGKSVRATIDTLGKGEPREVAEERHPPDHIEVFDGWVYWAYKDGPLKRQRLEGGPEELILADADVPCFAVDASGVLLIDGIELLRLRDGERQVIATGAYSECPVPLGDSIYWTERKGVFGVAASGGEPSRLVEVSKPEGLLSFEGALYSCFDDVLVRIDPPSETATPVRGFCKGDGLAVGENAHWFRTPYFEGWPPTPRARLIEVTSKGPTERFDGLGVSPPALSGSSIYWVGQADGAGWAVYRAEQP